MKRIKVKFILNGESVEILSAPNRRLVDVLREDLKLTGTKIGCSIGECGSCTVLIGGKAVNSCLVLIPQIEGEQVLTIEGLNSNGLLHPLQENFIRFGAVQCGYCTPGMILSSLALLSENNNPAEEEIREAIAGNLCRCTGYTQIIKAIQNTAKSQKS